MTLCNTVTTTCYSIVMDFNRHVFASTSSIYAEILDEPGVCLAAACRSLCEFMYSSSCVLCTSLDMQHKWWKTADRQIGFLWLMSSRRGSLTYKLLKTSQKGSPKIFHIFWPLFTISNCQDRWCWPDLPNSFRSVLFPPSRSIFVHHLCTLSCGIFTKCRRLPQRRIWLWSYTLIWRVRSILQIWELGSRRRWMCIIVGHLR